MLFLRLDLRYQEFLTSDVEILHAGDRNGRERPPVEGSRGDEQEVFIVTEYLFIEQCSIHVAEKMGTSPCAGRQTTCSGNCKKSRGKR